MANIESFSTFGLEPRRKLAFWNDRASESFSPLVSEPEDIRVFNGSIVRGSIGDMTVAEVYSDAQIVRHSRSHVARTMDSMFFLHLQLEDESVSRQDGRESVLRVGDFTLCDGTRRDEMIFTGANRMLVLGIPNASPPFRYQECGPPAASCRSCCATIGASVTRDWTRRPGAA